MDKNRIYLCLLAYATVVAASGFNFLLPYSVGVIVLKLGIHLCWRSRSVPGGVLNLHYKSSANALAVTQSSATGDCPTGGLFSLRWS